MEIKNTLSESFDFIEESCGSGSPEFEFYAEPKMVSEGVEEGAPSYPIIGRASGVFAPIGVMSRNNRIYDNDHYDYLLENQQLVDRIAHRGMLGTIGHHDKKVDDQDLAEGKVSHIVTNLRIVEEADGSRNLYGILEILDTPAGHLLKTYYDSGVPLFVSSRGGGNLLPVPNELYKRVDKTKYFLETFDIVKNPGFLQAKPVYEKVSESVEEIDEKVIVATKNHMENVEADKLTQARAKAGKTGLVDCGGKVDLDGSIAAQKKRLEAQCNEETEDKLDKLIESVSSLVIAISEGDKKVVIKQEDGEKKETKETKEAKEAKEAKETKETKIVEEKKNDKKDEEDKPEDEKNDDSESAVASSVTEEENKQKLSKPAEKLVKKVLDPHSGMTDADIADGKVQTKIFSPEQVHNIGVDYENASAKRKAMIKELKAKAKANSKPSTSKPKKEAKQLSLFASKEELINKLRSAIDEELEKDGPKGEVKPLKSAPKTGYFDKKIEAAKTNFRTKDKVARNAWKNFNPDVDDTDPSGYSDSFDSAMIADGERQEALDNYKYTRDKMNAERKAKPKRKNTESEMEQIQRIKDSKKQGIHMNDKNSKIEQALKTIDEADQVLAQPIVAVQNAGNSTKSAQEANPEVKEPVTMDRLELARALKAKVNNDKKVEV